MDNELNTKEINIFHIISKELYMMKPNDKLRYFL